MPGAEGGGPVMPPRQPKLLGSAPGFGSRGSEGPLALSGGTTQEGGWVGTPEKEPPV